MWPAPVIGNGKEDIGSLGWFFCTTEDKESGNQQSKDDKRLKKMTRFHDADGINDIMLKLDSKLPFKNLYCENNLFYYNQGSFISSFILFILLLLEK